jgi:hypothetical protein
MKTTFSVALLASAAALTLSAPAQAETFVFSTLLSNVGEPVPTSTATGAAVVSFDDAADTVTVLLSFAGLANNAPFGHIHCCTAVAGTGSSGVALGFTPLPQATTGSYVNIFNLAPVAFDNLLAGTTAGKAYVNIHTPGTYGAGEIRGFLTPVPEPETYALMLAGLGVLGWFAKRRQQA